MADDAAATSAEEAQITFNVKQSGDKKHVVTVPANSTVGELKAKLATPEFTDIPADRQRLIYSGRVLKDHDTLASAKIKDSHTVHLVSSAASNTRQNPASQGATGSATGGTPAPVPQLPQMATGTGNNPLAGLTGARYAGFHGLPGAEMFGPDGGMGPGAGPEQLLEMMENPMFLSQMNEAMDNPAVIEMMTQSPMIRNNPMLAEMIRNPQTRRMMFNPEMMRMQLQMQRAMGGGGPSFPAPGVTDTTPQPSATATGGTTATPNQPNTTGSTQPQDPFGSLFGNAGGAAGAGNPFAALFGQPGANPFAPQAQAQNNTATTGTESNTGSTPSADGAQARDQNAGSPPPNPFGNLFGTPAPGQANPLAEMTRNLMQNPEAMRQAMNMFGGMGGNAFGAPPNQDPSATAGTNNPAANPFANLFGPGGFAGAGGRGGAGGAGFGTPPPQDTRPPEEVYETQLAQLNTMGFVDFERNVRALRRSGGNVNGAVDWLLSEVRGCPSVRDIPQDVRDIDDILTELDAQQRERDVASELANVVHAIWSWLSPTP